MIFETERLIVRKLIDVDLTPFHKMQSNPKVMQYATGNVKSLEAHKIELRELIEKYDQANNDFWIYAIICKEDHKFIGTVALVKDGDDDEIGYRFLEKYWNRGYATEVCGGLIAYCKSIGMRKLIGSVVNENVASAKILERFNFKKVKQFISDDIQLPETKYELEL